MTIAELREGVSFRRTKKGRRAGVERPDLDVEQLAFFKEACVNSVWTLTTLSREIGEQPRYISNVFTKSNGARFSKRSFLELCDILERDKEYGSGEDSQAITIRGKTMEVLDEKQKENPTGLYSRRRELEAEIGEVTRWIKALREKHAAMELESTRLRCIFDTTLPPEEIVETAQNNEKRLIELETECRVCLAPLDSLRRKKSALLVDLQAVKDEITEKATEKVQDKLNSMSNTVAAFFDEFAKGKTAIQKAIDRIRR